MASLNGQIIGANAIRISWGRSTSRAPAAARDAAFAGGAYGTAAALPQAQLGGLGGGVGGYPGGFPGGYPGFNGAGMLVS